MSKPSATLNRQKGALHIVGLILLVFTVLEVVALWDFFLQTDETEPDSIPARLSALEQQVFALKKDLATEREKVREYELQKILGFRFDLQKLIDTVESLPEGEQHQIKASLEKSLFLAPGKSLRDVLINAARFRPEQPRPNGSANRIETDGEGKVSMGKASDSGADSSPPGGQPEAASNGLFQRGSHNDVSTSQE